MNASERAHVEREGAECREALQVNRTDKNSTANRNVGRAHRQHCHRRWSRHKRWTGVSTLRETGLLARDSHSTSTSMRESRTLRRSPPGRETKPDVSIELKVRLRWLLVTRRQGQRVSVFCD